MRKKRVVIIGAGPGGLAAALQCAHAGADVTVLEARSQVGGRCATLRAEGFSFDTGPTFYLYPRILKEIFQSVGRDIDQEIPMKRLDPQYRIAFGAGGWIGKLQPCLQRTKGRSNGTWIKTVPSSKSSDLSSSHRSIACSICCGPLWLRLPCT